MGILDRSAFLRAQRRKLLLGLCASGAIVSSRLVRGQTPATRRIGVLANMAPAQVGFFKQPLLSAFAKAGYKEGANLAIEWRFSELRPEELAALAEDLIRNRVELIVTLMNEPTAAAKRVTTSIPIVMHSVSLPVELGLVQSLSRPGANVTGTTYNSPEMAGKTLEILRDVAPGLKRVAVIWNPTVPGMRIYAEQAELAAKAFNVTFDYFDVTDAKEAATIIDRLAKSQLEALYVVGDPLVFPLQARIAAFALERKLVSIGVGPSYVHVGGLLFYGPDVSAITDRTVYYVDRILRGAAPADLPVEQPTKYLLSINRKTAQALGLKLPNSILVRADQIVE